MTGGFGESVSDPGDLSAVKELDAINKEIEGMKQERLSLQNDIKDKEENVNMKSMEVKVSYYIVLMQSF